MAKISKKQLEKARMKWLVKAHINLLKGWYSEIYGEDVEAKSSLRMDDEEIKLHMERIVK